LAALVIAARDGDPSLASVSKTRVAQFDHPDSFMQPTIPVNIQPGNPAFREESFGPLALVFRVKNEDEAAALASVVALDPRIQRTGLK
jgi:acyl-CoA reductase-like NAD-dependent aldehyde dehydrogenase